MSLFGYTIKELEKSLKRKEISAEDLVNMSLDRIKEVDDTVNAFITVDEERALEKARQLDQTAEESKRSLFAIPNAIKDNIVTKGLRTTCGSQFLKNFDDPLYDATVVEKLEKEDSITLGKLNMDEFAMGSTTENSSFKVTKNPWNTDYVPGGSSGGSAAAVAAGEVMFSLGSDTGGSIRQPAAYCGVVGMKPTYGLVSRFGLVGFASSFDSIGPITHTVEDNARVLEVIAGEDEMDATSASHDIPAYTESLTGDVKGLKIAVPEEYLGDGVDAEVKEAVLNALKMYELLGATWEKVSLPHSTYAVSAYYILTSAEASTSLARFDGVRYGERSKHAKNLSDMYELSRSEGFGEEVKRRIIFGTHALSAGNYESHYEKAQKIRTLVMNEFETIFNHYDIVMGPTTPVPAFKIGVEDDDPTVRQASDILTVPVNLAGLPAISLPCGFTEEGLPLGLQIIGKHFDESTIYRVAHAYEKATNHHKKRPVLEGLDK